MDRKILFSSLWRSLILLALVLSACQQPPTPTIEAETFTPPPTAAPSDTPAPLPSDTPGETAVPSDTPAPEETATPVVTLGPTQPVAANQNFALVCERNRTLDFQKVLETTPFFVKGQVIMTGPAESMVRTVASLSDQLGVPLIPVFRCTLGIPQQMPDASQGAQKYRKESTREGRNASFPFSTNQRRQPLVQGDLGMAMNLYQFDDQQVSLATLIDRLNATQADLAPHAKIYADPNYLTGHLANSACGSPFGVEGSPFGVEGSPFGVEGSPDGGLGINAAPDGFWDQWAFQHIGLAPPEQRNFDETGEGVRVGVFDTSPYTMTAGATPAIMSESVITPTLNLTVHYPYELPALQPATPVTDTIDVNDHGLFVSSLIHALAYQSQIHLYRVLDDAGCGDLYRLNMAMLDFLSEGWSEQGLKQPSVVNLSLGVRKPAELPTDPAAQAEAIAEIMSMEQEIQDAYLLVQQVDREIESLETVVHLADLAGIVIVAAAGNDSVFNDPPLRLPPLLNMPLPMDLPADYSFVIGVSASTIEDGPSCFSNLGDVAAPGADASEAVDDEGNPICKSQAATCPPYDPALGVPPPCEFGVISLAKKSPTNYAYWAGTSFATPLASGLAALVYQQTGNPALVSTAMTSRVAPILDSRYGSGLIQVPDALTP